MFFAYLSWDFHKTTNEKKCLLTKQGTHSKLITVEKFI